MRDLFHLSRRVIVSVLLLCLLLPVTAAACGESLFRIGKGVHYRAYSAPIPGTLLVYVRTDQERAVAEELQQAGHEVVMVDNDADLAMRLDQEEFDVLIAPASMRAAYESDTAELAAPPDWVPVFEGDEQDPKSVRAEYGRGVSSDDDVRQYLKAVHRSLKTQGR